MYYIEADMLTVTDVVLEVVVFEKYFCFLDMGQKIIGKYSCFDWTHWISAVFAV